MTVITGSASFIWQSDSRMLQISQPSTVHSVSQASIWLHLTIFEVYQPFSSTCSKAVDDRFPFLTFSGYRPKRWETAGEASKHVASLRFFPFKGGPRSYLCFYPAGHRCPVWFLFNKPYATCCCAYIPLQDSPTLTKGNPAVC